MLNHILKNKVGFVALAVSMALCSAPASASINYSFLGGGQNVSGGTFSTSGGPNVTVTGWANTTNAGAPGAADDKLAESNVFMWSGLGVVNSKENGTSPEHSTDNQNNNDMVLFSFAQEIGLTGLSIGWPSDSSSYDTDMTVMAYTGNSTPTLTGKTYADLTATGGWSLITHVNDVTQASGASFNAGGAISSMYWLIGAFNPLVGNDPGWSTGNDYVKISGLAGSLPKIPPPPHGVPEPVTLGLFMLGLLGMSYMRRRQRTSEYQLHC
jgi:hypothetical protein